MAKKKAALACSVCGSRNYTKSVSEGKSGERLEINKFCKYCNQYTLHKETKQRTGGPAMKFIKSVKDEMKQVTWPSGKQLRKDTLVVIETSIIFGVMFFVMDTAIQSLFAYLLK